MLEPNEVVEVVVEDELKEEEAVEARQAGVARHVFDDGSGTPPGDSATRTPRPPLTSDLGCVSSSSDEEMLCICMGESDGSAAKGWMVEGPSAASAVRASL